ncbi:hypothetical protein [Bacillus sp. CDB3]|uniref:hypothetical protein n=1 Tax=Bacillus sp. CDB3 TaxID=360310 RepID=UPI0009D8F2E3|nr:hypothetical protein [Bacillus sp. CDB3]OQR57416.1 hypothetical protein CDB3_07295 [Bacillus sp. CDB3]
MNIVLSASKLMKASEVMKRCAEMKKSPVLLLITYYLLLITELEAKCQLREMNRKVLSRREVN